MKLINFGLLIITAILAIAEDMNSKQRVIEKVFNPQFVSEGVGAKVKRIIGIT